MTRSFRFAVATLILLAATACNELDVGDLNNPSLEELQTNPTPSALNAAATGLLVGLRIGIAEPNGYIVLLGIMGREGFNLNTTSDPRYVAEMVTGPLDPGSGAFGANIWPQRYANIRNTNILLNAVDLVNPNLMPEAEQEGIRGFAKTIQAIELLRVIVTRDANGAVIDTDRPPTGEPGAIATRDEVYAHIVSLLDEGRTHLQAAGPVFSFPLGAGFTGFDTPATFIEVNRAIRARVAVYLDDFAGALTALGESFIDPAGALDLGVFHVYTTGSGDATNNILAGTAVLRANPLLLDGAQNRANGEPDSRVTTKIATTGNATGSSGGVSISSDRHFVVYPANTTPVPIIRNEELILLRAEANLGLGNLATAVTDINTIRTRAGGLANYSGAVTATALQTELLYNKRYSLMWEGGHSWIDFRHYGRLTDLPRQVTGGVFFTKMPFPNNECLARDPQPAAGCTAEPGI